MARYILLVITFLSIMPCLGQNLSFHHITNDDGLSQFSVNSIYIDARNNVWIGTREGLNLYNGNNIRVFRLEKDNPNSLFCNSIKDIRGDKRGKIYVLTVEGIAVYDERYETFQVVRRGAIGAIAYNDRLYYAEENNVFSYEDGSSSVVCSLPKSTIVKSLNKLGDSLWIGTKGDGLYVVNLPTRDVSKKINKADITEIYKDSRGNVWVGTWRQGAYIFCQDGKVEHIRKGDGGRALSSDFVRSFCEDDMGNMWIGTFKGLDLYCVSSGEVARYTTTNDDKHNLSNESVWCIRKDQQGTIWLGTYFGGVNYFNPEFEIYTKISVSKDEQKGLSCPIVGRMIEDKKGRLFIATEGGGLNIYDKNKRIFKWVAPSGKDNGVSKDNIKALFYNQHTDVLWIGTHLKGMYKYNLQSREFTNLIHRAGDDTTIPSDIVRDILPLGEDSLIVATQNGLCIVSQYTGVAKPLLKDVKGIGMVNDILLDRNKNLWIAATREGVYRYNLSTHSLKHFHHQPNDEMSISNNNIYCITEDSNGTIWLATAGTGVDRFLPDTESFENYDKEKNNLISNCIYRIEESPLSGRLIMITNNGMTIYDPKTGVAENHDASNGFPLNSINENGLFVDENGTIYIGGTTGLIVFKEKHLNFPQKTYSIHLSSLFVNGREVAIGDETGILKKSLWNTKEITLTSRENMFAIEFATSNYINANKDDIEYQLEGFSNRWTSTNGQKLITYTNLSSGTYTLRIRVKGKDANLYPMAELKIKVLPAWYATWWAFLLYTLVIVLAIVYVLRTYKTRLRLRESLKYQHKLAEDTNALNQSKIRFFTNISHEFRTPLTMIIAQVEGLLQSRGITPTRYNKLLNIYRNSINLRELIGELLDFKKQEDGLMRISVSEHNIVNFLYEDYLLFSSYAEQKGIELTFDTSSDDISLWYDPKQMQKVVYNLLSNAIKHTKPGDRITIRINEDEGAVRIDVEDTGSGISEKDIKKIFERFYQAAEENQMSPEYCGVGIGLALTKGIVELHHGELTVSSKEGEGSCFSISLLKGKAQYSSEEISVNKDDETLEHTKDNILLDTLEPEEDEKVVRTDKTILIAEDNAQLRDILRNIFSPYYNVLTAGDGEEAWEIVSDNMPDIVLSDVLMPNMSGIELCKKVKSEFDTCHIPVVLLTARTSLEQNLEGLKTGADDYITKPFNTKILISRCNNLMNTRQMLQEKFSKQPQMTTPMLATNPIDKDILDRAVEVIKKHIDDVEFNVNIFAQEMMLARTGLFTKIKAITGQTPNEFILTIRLKQGAIMLRNNPELNITEISERIGFSSARYFSRCFKNAYHVTPLEYRRGEGAE